MWHVCGVPVAVTPSQYGAGLTLADLNTPRGMLHNLAQYLLIRGMLSVIPRVLLDWKGVRAAGGLGPAQQYGGCRPALHLHLKNFELEYARPLPPGVWCGWISGAS
jgi:hypothetical protein